MNLNTGIQIVFIWLEKKIPTRPFSESIGCRYEETTALKNEMNQVTLLLYYRWTQKVHSKVVSANGELTRHAVL